MASKAASPSGAAGVRAELRSGILTLTLARPEKKNALDLATLAQLADHVEQAGRGGGQQVRAVVLAAEGDVFCGGGDIEVMRQFAGDAQATLSRLRGGLNRLVLAMRGCPVPIIGHVQGNAYGAGAVLAFQCDLTLAADEAQFSLSFRHVGLIPDTGGTWLLPRRLGLQRAKHLAWTAAPFSAVDAERWGLILRSVPKAQLAGAVANLAQAIAEGPAATMALAKRALQLGETATLEDALEREAHLQAQAFLTAEHAEGRDAFFERRKPDFRSRA